MALTVQARRPLRSRRGSSRRTAHSRLFNLDTSMAVTRDGIEGDLSILYGEQTGSSPEPEDRLLTAMSLQE